MDEPSSILAPCADHESGYSPLTEVNNISNSVRYPTPDIKNEHHSSYHDDQSPNETFHPLITPSTRPAAQHHTTPTNPTPDPPPPPPPSQQQQAPSSPPSTPTSPSPPHHPPSSASPSTPPPTATPTLRHPPPPYTPAAARYSHSVLDQWQALPVAAAALSLSPPLPLRVCPLLLSPRSSHLRLRRLLKFRLIWRAR